MKLSSKGIVAVVRVSEFLSHFHGNVSFQEGSRKDFEGGPWLVPTLRMPQLPMTHRNDGDHISNADQNPRNDWVPCLQAEGQWCDAKMRSWSSVGVNGVAGAAGSSRGLQRLVYKIRRMSDDRPK